MEPPNHDFPVNGKSHPEYMTVLDVAKRLKLSRSQIYALIDSGRMKCHRFTTGKSGGIRVPE